MKKLRINIIPENGKVINISLSYRLLKLLGILLGVIILGIAYLIAIYGKVYIMALRANILENENKKLKAEVEKVEEIRKRLNNIDRVYKKLYYALEIEKLPQFNPNKDTTKEDTLRREQNGNDEDMNKYIPDIYPVTGWISRRFQDNHLGIDISAKEGTPILSPIDGIVKESKFDSYFGNMLKISNDFGFEVVLCHNKENLVKVGDTVKKGTVVAYVGNTGKSSSAHLHYEIIFQGKNVDPLNYLPKGGE